MALDPACLSLAAHPLHSVTALEHGGPFLRAAVQEGEGARAWPAHLPLARVQPSELSTSLVLPIKLIIQKKFVKLKNKTT